MGWLTSIMAIIGIGQQAAPVLEKLLGGLGEFIVSEVHKLTGGKGDETANKISSMLDGARAGVQTLDTGTTDTLTWLKNEAPTAEKLVALFPGIDKALYNTRNIMADHGVGLGLALSTNQAAHANERTGKN